MRFIISRDIYSYNLQFITHMTAIFAFKGFLHAFFYESLTLMHGPWFEITGHDGPFYVSNDIVSDHR